MKIVVLSRYARKGASSRLRTLQYQPFLEAAGHEVMYLPFFDDAYLERLYSGVKSKYPVNLTYYFDRAKKLISMSKPDVIWLEKEAFPYWPAWLENLFLPRSVPIVSDYDDAVFHRYDLHSNAVARRLLGDKINTVMRNSRLVLAGNDYLGDHAKKAGAQWVEIVPTVLDANSYFVPERAADGDHKTVVGWIGSPSTWTGQADNFIDVYDRIISEKDVILRAIGANPDFDRPGYDFQPWSEDTEVATIQSMDIGIMPLPDNPWTRGKCGYKLIQYMACGLPVIASPVGVNSQIVEDGVNGFLADTSDEWFKALSTLVENPGLRKQMGAAGRKKVEDHYSVQVQGPRIAELLRQASQK